MAINFAQGFTLQNTEPIDNRLVLSKAEMLATKKSRMPTVYLAVCSDDGKLYLYNSANGVDETTGRFRVFESDVDTETLTETVTENLDGTTLVQKLDTQILNETVNENLDTITEEQIQTLF